MTTHEVAAQVAGPLSLPRLQAALDDSPPCRARTGPSGAASCIEEAAEWLGLSKRKTYDLVARGEIALVYIGRSRRIALAALESFVERLATQQE